MQVLHLMLVKHQNMNIGWHEAFEK